MQRNSVTLSGVLFTSLMHLERWCPLFTIQQTGKYFSLFTIQLTGNYFYKWFYDT